MNNQNWNCSYIQQKHTWELERNQANTGNNGVRVHCTNCPQVDTLFVPFARQYLDSALLTVAEAVS
jgi:hypothetical protein